MYIYIYIYLIKNHMANSYYLKTERIKSNKKYVMIKNYNISSSKDCFHNYT